MLNNASVNQFACFSNIRSNEFFSVISSIEFMHRRKFHQAIAEFIVAIVNKFVNF